MDKRRQDEDDGHTIADMNVEGMPWYRPSSAPRRGAEEQLSFRERLTACGGMLAAAAVVTAAFAGVYFLAILLMDLAW
ncbi:MAG: hypothetical protein IKN81_01570 [Oscillospiraceae bacterium]|nr:hypothetical protein [Oscillospiraceae bacterium]